MSRSAAEALESLRRQIAINRTELDRLRARSPHALGNLEHVHDLELTYTSNAIEGNTLSAADTMLVIEQGITIGGKPLQDHLEAIDHHDAITYVRDLARQATPLTEADLRILHSLVVKRSVPGIAGRYADQGRYVVTDAVVDIHPCNDGNGRTVRLLMNLLLIRDGYPPVAVRPEDRPRYINALQQAQAGQGEAEFNRLLYERLAATLSEYIAALQAAASSPGDG